MDHTYHNQMLDKISQVLLFLDVYKASDVFLESPTTLSFLEQWMANGFFIRWEEAKSKFFSICCIYNLDHVEIIGITYNIGPHTKPQSFNVNSDWDIIELFNIWYRSTNSKLTDH